MWLVNAVLGRVFDLLLYPFRALPPLAGLAFVSLLTAVGMLIVFRATSDQARIAAVKRSIHAALFEIRLFNDDLGAILRAQLEILRHNLTYLKLSLVPMLWMIVPLVLIVAQLQFSYGYGGLDRGRPVLVKAQLKERALAGRDAAGGVSAAPPDLALDAPAGIRVETPAVWLPGLKEAIWRIAPERDGEYELRIRVGDETATKTVRVSDAIVRRSPLRPEPGFVNELLYPAEPSLPDESALKSIAVGYPERAVRVFGWEIHWMIVFFVLSIAFAFALRNRFGVTL